MPSIQYFVIDAGIKNNLAELPNCIFTVLRHDLRKGVGRLQPLGGGLKESSVVLSALPSFFLQFENY